MDFKMAALNGATDMTWTPETGIWNNIWLSINVKRGTLFSAPLFGHRFDEVEKNTEKSAALVKAYAEEALQWIIDLGRATSIDIETFRDIKNWPHAIWLKGVAMQKDGQPVPFEKFVEVA